MTIIDIYSGFLGAGKTTLIKKMIQEAYQGQKLVLIENEFGEIGIDGGFMQDAGIEVTEMNSGCICCSLVGDFDKALRQVIETYHPDRILIEPSGVGKLSDVLAAAQKVAGGDVVMGHAVTVVDAGKVKIYSKNFGEFYNDQVATASTLVLSRTQSVAEEKLHNAVHILKELNPHAALITTPWAELSAAQLVDAMDGTSSLENELKEMEHAHHHEEEHHCCCGGHHGEHHHHEEEHSCGCGHHHEEEHHCCGGHHGEHHHDEEHHCCCGGHHGEHHHHEEEHSCGCGHHHHEEGHSCGCGHHHDHHADEVFTSWGTETPKKFTVNELKAALEALHSGKFGIILRAKGIVPCTDGRWIHFDYVPGEAEFRQGSAAVTGKLCVIGASLDETGVAAVFGV